MRGMGALGVAMLSLLVVILLVLSVFVFQLDNLEERFIAQSRQLRALGESTERLAGRIERRRLRRHRRRRRLVLRAAVRRQNKPEHPESLHVESLHRKPPYRDGARPARAPF